MDLINSIITGTSFLFIGQEYLRLFNGQDLFLKSIYNELINGDERNLNYNIFLQFGDTEKRNDKGTYEWILGQSEKISIPDQLSYISKLKWYGIITSAVDSIIPRAFGNKRNVIEVCSPDNKGIKNFTSSTELHISRLFGNLEAYNGDYWPPKDKVSFATSKRRAMNLLNRYNKNVISPYGIMIIDGYNPQTDWLSSEDFYSFLTDVFNKKQNGVHFFNFKPEFRDEYIDALEKDKILCTHKESFAEFLQNQEQKGLFNFSEIDFTLDSTDTKRITINKNKTLIIPKDKIENADEFMVLDDSIRLPEEKLTDVELAEKYSYFLYQSGIKPVWEGYKRRFNIIRNFEKDLRKKIESPYQEFPIAPIILSGQSGSGKTVSLGYVAYLLKEENKHPILFIPKGNEGIDYHKIDAFCKWLEDNQAKITYIFWDASFYQQEIEKYSNLNNFLVSRGRKVLVIGSAYALNESYLKNIKGKYEVVNVSTKLGMNEIQSLSEIFDRNSLSKKKISELWSNEYDNNLLVALYRLLPPTRHTFRKGILSEASTVEVVLESILGPFLERDPNPFEIAFKKTGFIIPEVIINDEKYKSNLAKLMSYVCIPGQYGLNIPMSLLFRTLEIEYDAVIIKQIYDIDLIRIIETTSGRFEISTRNRIEAEIIVNNRLADSTRRAEIITSLIENVKNESEDNYLTSRTELNFIIDFLQAIGPNGKDKELYKKEFLKIALSLKKIRQEYNIYNERTILQEAHFIRECSDRKEKYMLEVQDLLETTINKYKKQNNNTLGYLCTELATNYNFQIRDIKEKEKAMRIYNKVYNTYEMATKFLVGDPYHPIDVLLNASKTILSSSFSNFLTNQDKSLIAVNLWAVLNSFEDLRDDPEYNAIKYSIGELLGENLVSDDAFDTLISQGSATGVYLKAKNILEETDLDKPIDEKESRTIRLITESINCLETYADITNTDTKCLFLLLKLYWLKWHGKPIFYSEKDALYFNQDQWIKILEIVEGIINLSENAKAWVLYIKGIALFHLDRYIDCFDFFRAELWDSRDFSIRRIRLNYLVADPLKQKPRLFNGTLTSIKNGIEAEFYINELKRNVSYRSREFVDSEPSLNRRYDTIVLGFNYLGILIYKLN